MKQLLLCIVLYLSIGHCCTAQVATDTTVSGKVKWKHFRQDNQLYEEGTFENGKRTGLWKYYTVKKILYKKEKYSNGKLSWTYIYNERGRIIIYIDIQGKVHKKPDCGC